MRGRPVPGVNVRVLKLGYNAVTGERTLGAPSIGSASMTDDRGEYRAYGLPPGGYLVLVAPRRPVGTRQRRHSPADARTRFGGRCRRRAPAPRSRRPRRGPGSPRHAASAAARVNYAPVFHPGATDIRAAATIRARPERGAHRRGYRDAARADRDRLGDGHLHVGRASAVALGRPRAGRRAHRDARRRGPARACPLNRAPTARTSSPSVAPGAYTIKAVIGSGRTRRRAQPADAVGRGRRERQRPGPRHPADAPARRRDQRARRLRGLAADGRRAPDAVVRAHASRIGRHGCCMAAAAASMRRDASRSRASRPTRINSRRRGTLQARSDKWTIKSSTANGRESFEAPLRVNPNETLEWTVTYTDKPATLTGVLQDPGGRAATDYYILVFSADRRHWTPGSRRVRMTRPATDGSYSRERSPARRVLPRGAGGSRDRRVERSRAARAARPVVGQGHAAGRRDDDAVIPDWGSVAVRSLKQRPAAPRPTAATARTRRRA